jgi:hypothetical protein
MSGPPPPLPSWRRDPAASAARLQTLTAWRRGTRLALLAAPAAAVAGPVAPAVVAVAFGLALAACALTELTRRDTLRACVLHPELCELPAVARERARLTAPDRRRRLARTLRRVAVYRPGSAQERRLTPYPLERLAAARPGLLAVADAVETASRPDPALLVEIEELLCDGSRSPLLRTDIPIPELGAALDRVRVRLSDDTPEGAACAASAETRPAAATPPHKQRRTTDNAGGLTIDKSVTLKGAGAEQTVIQGGGPVLQRPPSSARRRSRRTSPASTASSASTPAPSSAPGSPTAAARAAGAPGRDAQVDLDDA